MTDSQQFDRPIRELNFAVWHLARDMARQNIPYARRAFGLPELQARRLAELENRELLALADDPQPHWEIHHPRQLDALLDVIKPMGEPAEPNHFRAEIKELNLSLWHLARDMARTDPDIARRVFGLKPNHCQRLAQLNLKELRALADDMRPTWQIHLPKSMDLLIGHVIAKRSEDRMRLVRLSVMSSRIPALSLEDL